MFRNYLLLALRNMRKNKLHTFINMLGITVAFACSIFISLLVYRHFTFDDFQVNKHKLYKVYHFANGQNGEETGTAMPYPLTPALKAENIGVVKATGITREGNLVRYKEKTLDMSTTMVDPDFLTMFTLPVVEGTPSGALNDLSNCVLTQLSAKKIFGNEDPIGKAVEVKLAGNWYKLIVAAIVKDFPENSTIKFSLLARTEVFPYYAEMRSKWDSRNHPVYVQLADNATQQQVENRLRTVVHKYTPDDTASAKRDGYKPDKNGDYQSLQLLPFSDEHFTPDLGNGAVKKTFLYILILIASVIVLIASFNFVNLNIGLSFTRTKEIGVRKCLGAGKRQIWIQVWGESLMMVLLSMLLAIGIISLLSKGFNQAFNTTISAATLATPAIASSLVALILAVSFIASGYPSSVMARLKAVEVLKGKITVRRRGMLRSALILVQFVIAIVLICSTIIIYQQFNYLRSAPMGYNTTSVISIPLKNDEKGRDIIAQLRTRLASQSSVLSVSGSDANLGVGEDHSTSTSVMCFTYGEKTVCGQMITADYDILKTLDIKPTFGRDFSLEYADDTTTQVIATKSYAAQFGEKNMTGFSYFVDSSQPKVRVDAVIPDIQIKSMSDKQKPIVIYLSRDKSMSYAWIKVRTENPIATMDLIKNTYNQIEPGVEFKGSYANENIDRLYTEEKLMANLFTSAAAIAIVLSCMGLFGIASIVIRQRVKEIGVRKALGASVTNIFTLVAKEFIKPVLVAFLIAAPLAWWLINMWLQDYSYRINVHWWVFAVAGAAALIVTICTVSFQSLKASIANPVKSLRTE